MVLRDKSQVEEALIRAQSAVLNPGRDASEFLPHDGESGGERGKGELGEELKKETRDRLMKEAQNCEVKFSPNVVLMDITGPGLPNLSFIDLPGVIETTENVSTPVELGGGGVGRRGGNDTNINGG